MSWVIEDIIDYLVAAGRIDDANEVQKHFNLVFDNSLYGKEEAKESAKEKARLIAYTFFRNCNNISE